MSKLIIPLWILASFSLLLYSFTQVDLSLTLSQVSIWQGIQKAFQYVGYFNRPLSAYLYVGIIIFIFALYGFTLKLIADKKILLSTVSKVVVILAVVLFSAYSAFSYDIFNYIFDAKIITFYHENPYEHKALDYPGDPMLSFMHWTHRTYPYGPFWLGLTVPLSVIGLGYFLVTFYLFKLLMVSAYIWSAYLVGRIAKKMELNPALCVAAFALNPLVIIESLISAHNDIVMLAFALFGVLTFLERKYIQSITGIIVSIGVKFVTGLIIPAILLRGLLGVSKNTFFLVLIVSMGLGVLFASSRTNFQPWYLLYVITFASFLSSKRYILIPLLVIPFFGLMQYVPYLYLGNWDPPVPMILNNLMLASLGISILLVLFSYFFGNIFSKKR